MPHASQALISSLAAITGPAGIKRQDELSGRDPGFDKSNFAAGLSVAAGSPKELARVVAICAGHGVAMVPQGGRTGLVGGGASKPGEVVLMTERLDRIEAIDPVAMTATVEAGVRLETLQRAAAVHGLSVGIDLGARGSCTIGGMIATNAGGIEAFRHGVMRQRVLGLEVVLADGRVMSDLTRVSKATVGYDLKQLFIGSEGTLGVITRAVLRLTPLRTNRATALAAAASTRDALAALALLQAEPAAELTAAEVMWQDYFSATIKITGPAHLAGFAESPITVLYEVAAANTEAAMSALERGLGQALTDGHVQDAVIAKSDRERQELWRLRDDVFVSEQGFPHHAWFDVSLPISALDGYVTGLFDRLNKAFPAATLLAVAHLADGNLHLTVASPAPFGPDGKARLEALVYAGINTAGGAFSAEHGVGTDKLAALEIHADPVKLALMRTIKQALDPHNLMNPGKILRA